MNPQGTDPKLIDALNRASSLELFELSTIIERMLADPRRIIAVRTNMHMGQSVRFLDWRDGQMRNGRVVAMGDAKVTLHEEGTRREWKLPYAAVEPPFQVSSLLSLREQQNTEAQFAHDNRIDRHVLLVRAQPVDQTRIR